MNTYYFILEVKPQLENPLGAHVPRAIVHIWLLSTDIEEARVIALRFLTSDGWEVIEEKDAYLLTPEKINGLGEEDSSCYHTAQSEGIHAKFNYWHK
ncbi:hypothetical protein [Desulfosediminicola flagellatus]|uniref:hypothetical protein n=1 Tax=Desulfosediminicola flagellatus TaxID=2569541 RepID=UPI0010ACB80F|nr:hypothetical protein [Desulfosediminicola flagellatus]